jgi:HEAT repeat protein
VPAEGDQVLFDALVQFVEIHDLKSDSITWKRFAGMLEQNNPLLLQIAMDQMLKFRRGEPDLVMSLRPLLDHPRADLRERAVALMGQLVERHTPDGIPEEPNLRSELVAAARRDPVIEVRVAATAALEWFRDPAITEILQQIADTDPERAVRYTAESLLLRRRSESPE